MPSTKQSSNESENGNKSKPLLVAGLSIEEWLKANWEYPVIKWDGGHWGLVVNMVTGEVGS